MTTAILHILNVRKNNADTPTRTRLQYDMSSYEYKISNNINNDDEIKFDHNSIIQKAGQKEGGSTERVYLL